MKLLTSNQELQAELSSLKNSKSIGLVPTMGNLHSGHIKLVKAARAECDVVVCSIFVNPTQFGPGEDLESYPRTLAADEAILTGAGCDILFAPAIAQMYGGDLSQETLIHVPGISENYCGRSRPGHFDGVATIVSKLFNIVQPTSGYFGLKDYQQFLIIAKLVEDLRIPIRLVGVETERETNGLAKSSRNSYLSTAEKKLAANLYASLKTASTQLADGKNTIARIEDEATNHLRSLGFKVDYFSVSNAQNLQPASELDKELVILAAVYLGKTRLIDNIRVRL